MPALNFRPSPQPLGDYVINPDDPNNIPEDPCPDEPDQYDSMDPDMVLPGTHRLTAKGLVPITKEEREAKADKIKSVVLLSPHIQTSQAEEVLGCLEEVRREITRINKLGHGVVFNPVITQFVDSSIKTMDDIVAQE